MRRDRLPQDERAARAVWSRVAEPGDTRVVALRGTDEQGRPGPLIDALGRLAASRDPRHEALQDRLDALVAGRDQEIAHRCGARVLVPGDAQWPTGLDDLEEQSPYCLWVRGPLDLAQACARSVAVVGSRAASAYGVHVAGDLGAGLAGRGFLVVSGAAFGIDAAAHRGALSVEAPTVAVLAGGVDRPYPAAHASLLAAVAQTGAVLSEMPPGCVPSRHRFLQRNRLIAALTGGTVVVEAGYRSGALSTARHAQRLLRPVGAVPGPVTSPASAGCHELVRAGGAELVTDASEVAELCGVMGADLAPPRRGERRPDDLLEPRDHTVLEAVPAVAPAPVDSVARAACVTVAEARAAVARLEQLGRVEMSPAGVRLARAGRGGSGRRGGGACSGAQQTLPMG